MTSCPSLGMSPADASSAASIFRAHGTGAKRSIVVRARRECMMSRGTIRSVRTMPGKHSRLKGINFERYLAQRFRSIFPDARRGLQSRMGFQGESVPDVDVPCFWIEAKRGARCNHRSALAQAIRDCVKGKTPIAVLKEDRREPVVVLLLEDFLELVGEWYRMCER